MRREREGESHCFLRKSTSIFPTPSVGSSSPQNVFSVYRACKLSAAYRCGRIEDFQHSYEWHPTPFIAFRFRAAEKSRGDRGGIHGWAQEGNREATVVDSDFFAHPFFGSRSMNWVEKARKPKQENHLCVKINRRLVVIELTLFCYAHAKVVFFLSSRWLLYSNAIVRRRCIRTHRKNVDQLRSGCLRNAKQWWAAMSLPSHLLRKVFFSTVGGGKEDVTVQILGSGDGSGRFLTAFVPLAGTNAICLTSICAQR